MNKNLYLKKLLHHTTCILKHRNNEPIGQYRLLSKLFEHGSMEQKALQDKMCLKSASISELLIKLENSGLIIRKKDENDRRNIIISLTNQGEIKAQEYIIKNELDANDLFECLNEQEKEQLKVILEKLEKDWSSKYTCRRD